MKSIPFHHKGFIETLLALAVVLAGVVLMIARAQSLTLWSDEFHTVRIIRMPIASILTGQYSELNPPLYFAALKLYLHFFGHSEMAMRSFSIVFSFISLILCFTLASELLGRFQAALGATALAAFHPLFIYISTEIRSYSLLLFFSLVSFLSYSKLRANPKYPLLWGSILPVSLVLCLYTHHFGVLVLISILVFVLLDAILQGGARKVVRFALVGFGAVMIAYLPSLGFLWNQASRVYTDPANIIAPAQFLQIFTFSIHHPIYESLVFGLACAAFIGGLVLLLLRKSARLIGLFLCSSLFISALFVIMASFIGVNIVPRYLSGVIPLALIAIASTFGETKQAWWNRVMVGIGLATILVYILYGTDFTLNTWRENQLVGWKSDWKHLSEEIRALQQGDEPMVLMGWDATPLQFYLNQEGLTSYLLERELAEHPRNSYLVIMTPNSRTIPALDRAEILYEDKREGVRILRLNRSAVWVGGTRPPRERAEVEVFASNISSHPASSPSIFAPR